MKVILTALTVIIAALPTIGVATLIYVGAFVVGGWLLWAYVVMQLVTGVIGAAGLRAIWEV